MDDDIITIRYSDARHDVGVSGAVFEATEDAPTDFERRTTLRVTKPDGADGLSFATVHYEEQPFTRYDQGRVADYIRDSNGLTVNVFVNVPRGAIPHLIEFLSKYLEECDAKQ
jgi:hypothetical protein